VDNDELDARFVHHIRANLDCDGIPHRHMTTLAIGGTWTETTTRELLETPLHNSIPGLYGKERSESSTNKSDFPTRIPTRFQSGRNLKRSEWIVETGISGADWQCQLRGNLLESTVADPRSLRCNSITWSLQAESRAVVEFTRSQCPLLCLLVGPKFGIMPNRSCRTSICVAFLAQARWISQVARTTACRI
jgi:hypothetical protein